MPAFHAASAARHSGSRYAGSNTGRPSERFSTRMLYLFLRRIAVKMAWMTLESVPFPLASSAQVDEIRIGRHADIDAARVVRADNAGNVSSVAVSVACAAADE